LALKCTIKPRCPEENVPPTWFRAGIKIFWKSTACAKFAFYRKFNAEGGTISGDVIDNLTGFRQEPRAIDVLRVPAPAWGGGGEDKQKEKYPNHFFLINHIEKRERHHITACREKPL